MDVIYFEGTEYALPKYEIDILTAHRFGAWQIGNEIKQPGDTTQLEDYFIYFTCVDCFKLRRN